MNFVIVHGGFCGGWWLTQLAHALRIRGHTVFTPTLTGLGDRVHLATPEVGLETHTQDVLNLLHFEDLEEVNLVGHSYGGMVVTGAADRARDRIRKLIYFDAFVPSDGECLYDFLAPDIQQAMNDLADSEGEGWRVPSPFSFEQFGITDPEIIAWNDRGNVMQPLRTFTEPARLQPEPWSFPVSYIYCASMAMGLFDRFRGLANDRGWDCHDAPLTHAGPAVQPGETADLLLQVAAV